MKVKKLSHLISTAAMLTIAILLCGCYSTKKSVERSLPYSTQMSWPEEYKPEESKFFVHNEIDIIAAPQVVWDILMQAETWPVWYEGAKNVK